MADPALPSVSTRTYLRGFGGYVPERVVANAEVAALVGEEADWIRKVSGIRQRRYAADSQTVADLAVLAAEDCLTRCGVAAAELGMIVVASGSAERFCPGPAATVASRLGFAGTFALDVPVASAGSLIALNLAMRFAPSVGKVLVIGAEIMSRRVRLTPEGRDTAILFGDGAGACLVDAGLANLEQGALELVDAALYTDGNAAEILRMEEGLLHMEGGSVILQAARKVPAAIRTLLERNGVSIEQVGTLLMHQANRNLIAKVASTLKLAPERAFLNIERFGNTSSASLLLAAAEWHAATPAPAAPVVFAAFGTGLNWGAILGLPVAQPVTEGSA